MTMMATDPRAETGEARTATEWSAENTRGLAFAAAGAWSDAADAFAVAADSLASDTAADVVAHDALALVTANLAHARYRSGHLDDAIRHQQRACALRVALVGEDAVSVARARSDLAVMLAAAGRYDEAPMVLQRAVAGIERNGDEADLRLAVPLENTARAAIAAALAGDALAPLVRLRALLDRHGMDTARADALSRLAASAHEVPVGRQTRSAQRDPFEQREAPLAGSDAESSTAVMVGLDELPTPPPASEAEWDDQPLRDAVAVTDNLLRTTPSGLPALRVEPTPEEPWVRRSLTPIDAHEPLGGIVMPDAELELIDVPASTLGFEVSYDHEPVDDEVVERDPSADSVPMLETAHTVELELAALEPLEIDGRATPAIDHPVAPSETVRATHDSVAPAVGRATPDVPHRAAPAAIERVGADPPAKESSANPSTVHGADERIRSAPGSRPLTVVLPTPAPGNKAVRGDMARTVNALVVETIAEPKSGNSGPAYRSVKPGERAAEHKRGGAPADAPSNVPRGPARSGGQINRHAPKIAPLTSRSNKGGAIAIGSGVLAAAAAAAWYFLRGG